MEQGRVEEAIPWYRQALQPHTAGIHINLGIALVKGGQIDEVGEHFSEALKIDPDFLPAQENLNELQSP